MAIFLYTYNDPAHHRQTTRYGVIGARKTESESLNSRFSKLRRDDWIVLRDSSSKDSLVILGCHQVLANVWDQSAESPYRALLWPDEEAERQVKYELRVPVDHRSIPFNRSVRWGDLDFGATSQSTLEFFDVNRWSTLFRGNFLTGNHVPETFLEVLGLPKEFLDQID